MGCPRCSPCRPSSRICKELPCTQHPAQPALAPWHWGRALWLWGLCWALQAAGQCPPTHHDSQVHHWTRPTVLTQPDGSRTPAPPRAPEAEPAKPLCPTDLLQGWVVHGVWGHLRQEDDQGGRALGVGVAAHSPRGVQQLPFLIWMWGQVGLFETGCGLGGCPPQHCRLLGLGPPGTEGHMYRQRSPVLSWSR